MTAHLPTGGDDQAEQVRAAAVERHQACSAADEPVEDAFCTCWAETCTAIGPCGGCYQCRDGQTEALEVSEAWRDHNAESAERFRDQRDAALADLAAARARIGDLEAIRDAVIECPDDARRELYRADKIAGEHIVENVRLRTSLSAALADAAAKGAALARVERRDNLVWRLIAEAHRKYPDAGVHWVNADDLRAALSGDQEQQADTGSAT